MTPPPGTPKTVEQAAALPFRRRDNHVEICLVTTRTTGRWSIPKGFIEPGDTAARTAGKEAREEAGVHGRVVGGPVGYYEIIKFDARFTVAVYLLEVDRVEVEWDEQDVRARRWVTADEAVGLLEGRPVEPVFRRGLTQIAAQAVHRGSTR